MLSKYGVELVLSVFLFSFSQAATLALYYSHNLPQAEFAAREIETAFDSKNQTIMVQWFMILPLQQPADIGVGSPGSES